MAQQLGALAFAELASQHPTLGRSQAPLAPASGGRQERPSSGRQYASTHTQRQTYTNKKAFGKKIGMKNVDYPKALTAY